MGFFLFFRDSALTSSSYLRFCIETGRCLHRANGGLFNCGRFGWKKNEIPNLGCIELKAAPLCAEFGACWSFFSTPVY